MLLFWIAAAVFSAAVAGLVLWRAARPSTLAAEPPEQAVYARQLAEIDELKARGLLDEDGWKASRSEAGRRLLAAADQPAATEAPGQARRDRWLVAGGAAGAALLGAAAYVFTGSPGRPDEPYATRMKLWDDMARTHPEKLEPAQAAALLEARARLHPDDPQVWTFLGQAYAASNQFLLAAGAFEKVTTLSPKDARAWAALGETETFTADGRVGPEARRAFERALDLDPASAAAHWWLGRDDVLAGRKVEGLAHWRVLLGQFAADDPRRAALQTQIAAAESGPSDQARAVAAAPAQAQAAMIRGMVARLAQRLQTGSGGPQDWARLVRAYAVLGDTAARDQALARARRQFAGRPADLALIDAAARGAPPS